MTQLSVNINKYATLRNARGGNMPDILKIAKDCERFGAQGITVHPRPDERHISYNDVIELKDVITTEFNIEGYPSKEWMQLVLEAKPQQATLVPDGPDVLTSNAGWDTRANKEFLKEIVTELKMAGIRTSIFMETDGLLIEQAAECGTDRIELYTESYAIEYSNNKEQAIKEYINASKVALENGLELNAGHDLNLENLKYFADNIHELKEVSIGHALICDAIYYGLENTIQLYLKQLKKWS